MFLYPNSKMRKDNAVSKLSKIPKAAVLIVYYVSFVFAYYAQMKIYAVGLNFDATLNAIIDVNSPIFLPLYGLIIGGANLVLTEVFFGFYYLLATRAMREVLPFTNVEFSFNMRFFIMVRNIIMGSLSFLMLLEGNYYLAFGLIGFEMVSNFVVLPFAFSFFRKTYIKVGYSKKVYLSFLIPFLIITASQVLVNFL